MDQFLASLRGSAGIKVNKELEALSQRLESLRYLSSRLSSIDDGVIGEREAKLLNTVSRTEPAQEEIGKRGILDVVKGFLPGGKKDKKSAV